MGENKGEGPLPKAEEDGEKIGPQIHYRRVWFGSSNVSSVSYREVPFPISFTENTLCLVCADAFWFSNQLRFRRFQFREVVYQKLGLRKTLRVNQMRGTVSGSVVIGNRTFYCEPNASYIFCFGTTHHLHLKFEVRQILMHNTLTSLISKG